MANGSPNLDFAMRLSADLGDAAQEVAQIDAALEKIEASGAQAAKGLNSVTAANTKNSTAATASAAAMGKQANAANVVAKATRTAAISQGQYNMAMRQLPAQITDIFTGLASGQSPFIVLIQQGGQLKDSFGGVVPAARALLGAISPLAIAGGAAAGAIAALAYASIEAASDQAELTKALLQTGNFADTSAGEVDALIEKLAELDSVTVGGAREALLATAASGRIAGDQFERVATTAARMEVATGQSIDTTIEKFEQIAQDPVAALLKLNETEHFLTQAQLDRVRALVEEGKEQDAAAEGARIYADRLSDIASAAEAARPHLSRMWQETKEGASAAWEETKNFAEFLAASAERFNKRSFLQKMGPAAGFLGIADLYNAEPPAAAAVSAVPGAVDSAEEKRKQDAQKTREREREQFLAAEARYLDDAARKEKEIAAAQDLVTKGTITQAEADKRIADINDAFARRAAKTKSDAEREQEAAERELENLTKQATLLGTVADGEKRVSEEARVRYEIEQGAYQLASAATKQQLIAQAQALDSARKLREEQEKQKKALEETTREYERLRDQLQTPIEAAASTVTKQIEDLNAALKAGIINAAQYRDGIARIGANALTRAPETDLSYFGIGDPDAERMASANLALQNWFAEQLAIINAGRAAGKMANDYWDQQEAAAKQQFYQQTHNLALAQQQLQLMQVSSAFGAMAQMAKAFGGEQSKTYQALFALSKGFAVAQAVMAMWQNVAEASKVGWPQNIGLIAQALGQGAQIVAMIKGANFTPNGYATGGRITGPGTGTSDSIPIWASRDEFMTRAAVVRQPGALPFLEDFNRRGMDALQDWRGYATGGLITAPEPRSRISDSNAMQTSVNNRMRVYMLQDQDRLIEALAKHPRFEKAVVAVAGENGGSIQAQW